MLIECRKEGVPSLLLEDFNYYFNKAINNYINKRYNIYDVGQQQTDDVRVLKATAILQPEKASDYSAPDVATSYLSSANHQSLANLHGATYEVDLPSDYLHLLNCICIYKVKKNYKCYDGGSYVPFAAKRLTADSWSTIINDYYNRPSYKQPYYYIHNVNNNSTVPTYGVEFSDNEYMKGTDMVDIYGVTTNGSADTGEGNYNVSANQSSNFSRTMTVGNNVLSTVEKATAHRYGNASKVRMEIRYGRDDSVFELAEVHVDYIKAPQFIRLTQEQVDLVEDTSQIMEFPDYVCQEIINELTLLVMARTSDPVLNTFAQIKETIANPAQQAASAQQQS